MRGGAPGVFFFVPVCEGTRERASHMSSRSEVAVAIGKKKPSAVALRVTALPPPPSRPSRTRPFACILRWANRACCVCWFVVAAVFAGLFGWAYTLQTISYCKSLTSLTASVKEQTIAACVVHTDDPWRVVRMIETSDGSRLSSCCSESDNDDYNQYAGYSYEDHTYNNWCTFSVGTTTPTGQTPPSFCSESFPNLVHESGSTTTCDLSACSPQDTGGWVVNPVAQGTFTIVECTCADQQ